MSLLTHDKIRTAAIATLKANSDVNAVVKKWYRYILPIGNVRCPAFYIGKIVQPFTGACGTDQQYTTISTPMDIYAGVLCCKHDEDTADVELGEVYELVYNALKASPTLGLDNFNIHNITPVTTMPTPQYGKFTIGAEMILHATWEE